ncbi:MAG: tyrosine--tRNA ligase [Candidatus Pacebacteria bacterium]|nr:tyrosine--tRNA ligase [Candidatus Paceibacterota bacterium]
MNNKIKTLFTHNTKEVIIKTDLEKKLNSGKKLRIKLGCDPSRPDLHLGHSIVLRKLKEFQDLGHQVVFIIGDYTGMIGDPSGKSKTRPALSKEEVQKNAESYFAQVGKILDIKKTEIRYNSEWFSKLNFEDVLKLLSKFTVARILERDDFSKRLKSGIDIATSEMLYPIMQAYDSIMIKADVEIGGTDQKFNMLAGRDLQRKMNLPEQNVLTTPLLVGLDGKEKMSKSLDNYIGITEEPDSMFGKIMSISDEMIFYYFKLLTDISENELQQIKIDLKNPSKNPRDLKVKLAREIITIYHNKKSAEEAEEEFNKIFRDKQKPSDIKEFKLSVKEGDIRKCRLLDLLIETKLASSKSNARRLVQQGGVKINDVVQKDFEKNIEVKDGMIAQVGKRRFMKIKV